MKPLRQTRTNSERVGQRFVTLCNSTAFRSAFFFQARPAYRQAQSFKTLSDYPLLEANEIAEELLEITIEEQLCRLQEREADLAETGPPALKLAQLEGLVLDTVQALQCEVTSDEKSQIYERLERYAVMRKQIQEQDPFAELDRPLSDYFAGWPPHARRSITAFVERIGKTFVTATVRDLVRPIGLAEDGDYGHVPLYLKPELREGRGKFMMPVGNFASIYIRLVNNGLVSRYPRDMEYALFSGSRTMEWLPKRIDMPYPD